MELLATAILALALGAIVGWLITSRLWEGKLRESAVRIEERERNFSEQKSFLEASERKLTDTFKALAMLREPINVSRTRHISLKKVFNG